ncbi:hypothetical protein [Miniphocaeibacter massiliensis]|uniref:hypothetical protein n=1 Tax=Miniphocaeibacter massiliensis TaxID=2041841 RepID=UPI000C06FF2E|nr:hypothetical protein [Miniphocaeibacter massiliensis]
MKEASEVDKRDSKKIEDTIMMAKNRCDEAIEKDKLDCIVFLDNSSAVLTAVAGYPEITVPIGIDKDGTPHGLTFTAGLNEDKKILEYAYSFEQNTNLRYVIKEKDLIKKTIY